MRRYLPLFLSLLLFFPASAAGAAPARQGNMPYKGGPVMHQPTLYLIFWLPDGYHFRSDGTSDSDNNFEGLVQQFFGDLSGSDFYSLVTQYHDRNGSISDSFNVGDAVVDSTPFPSGEGSSDNPLLDSDVRAEITSVANSQGWDNTPGESAFFVFTPYDVITCYNPNKTSTCTYQPGNKGRCGYHSWFTDSGSRYLYGLISDGDTFCHSWQRQLDDNSVPSGDVFADMAVDTASHEWFETVTDPFLNAWGTGQNEIGDKCSSYIGPTADDGSDIQLNGDGYIIQKEWSNQDHGCVI